jgi:hypothetical protein
MGKTHLKPYVKEIIQSAKLTASEQTKVCSEAHDSCGIDAYLARNCAASAQFGREWLQRINAS